VINDQRDELSVVPFFKPAAEALVYLCTLVGVSSDAMRTIEVKSLGSQKS
jgi:hypothetical protein